MSRPVSCSRSASASGANHFPRFDRNPGTGRPAARAAETDLAVQHQRVFPTSSITLPVVPRDRR